MKNLIKLLIPIFIVIFSFANAQSMQPGGNSANPNLDKFVGTWKWESNGDSFKMILNKINTQMPVNIVYTADQLYGVHEYKVNNSIVETSLNNINIAHNLKKYTLSSFGGLPDPHKIILGISHISKNKGVNAVVEWLDATHIKIVSIENYQGVKMSTPNNPYHSEITLPQNIILTKQ
jgi:hypothetical protein